MSVLSVPTGTPPVNRKEKNQGMNWISQHKRLAIYLRDGLACCYCGAAVADGAQLTLDHLKPYSKGGSNDAQNLVTCCHRCNAARGNRSWTAFAKDTAQYLDHGIKGEDIIAHIRKCTRRGLNVKEAFEMVSRQGSCFKVLKSLQP